MLRQPAFRARWFLRSEDVAFGLGPMAYAEELYSLPDGWVCKIDVGAGFNYEKGKWKPKTYPKGADFTLLFRKVGKDDPVNNTLATLGTTLIKWEVVFVGGGEEVFALCSADVDLFGRLVCDAGNSTAVLNVHTGRFVGLRYNEYITGENYHVWNAGKGKLEVIPSGLKDGQFEQTMMLGSCTPI
jgi:hypothetical protein